MQAPPGQYGPPPTPGAGFGAPPPASAGNAGNAKLLRGCGGCGCAFALLLLIGGAVLLAFGLQPATREALPFGIITLGLAVPVTIIGAVLLVVGITKLKKAGG